jgi:hypothetical protein
MKENVLILTGAGLTAGPDFFRVTTSSITKAFISYNHPDLTDDKELIKFIYNEFCYWNKLDETKVEDNLHQINFETILQMIEELYSYVEDYERSNRFKKYQNSVKNSVFSLNKRLITQIDRVRSPNGKHLIFIFLEKLYNHLIDEISRQIKPHNENSTNKGMVEFSDFLDTAFDKKSYNRRIYTLNYDNWFNQFRDYFDGFITDVFDSNEVINNKSTDCYYNLHGCILWEIWKTAQKNKEPEERKYIQSFDPYTISREALLHSPIISGYNKLTRINSSPFLEIFHSLTSDCISAKKVLIIGYSFNDPHVNNNLQFIDKDSKIIIVLYYDHSSLNDQTSDLHRIMYDIGYIFNSQFSNYKVRSGLNHTVDSDDGKISIFIDGIGQSFYNEYSKI